MRSSVAIVRSEVDLAPPPETKEEPDLVEAEPSQDVSELNLKISELKTELDMSYIEIEAAREESTADPRDRTGSRTLYLEAEASDSRKELYACFSHRIWITSFGRV